MCGIFCAVSASSCVWPDADLQERLIARGPDSCNRAYFHLPNGVYISFCSTVLSLRGSVLVPQPVQYEDLLLCWNGEAWSIDNEPTNGSDTEAVLKLCSDLESVDLFHEQGRGNALALQAKYLAELLSRVSGPYAFILYDHKHHTLFYGRDFLGRRSLLSKNTPEGDLLLSSVSDVVSHGIWKEVQADGVYYLDLSTIPTASQEVDSLTPKRSPYVFMDDDVRGGQTSAIPHLVLNKTVSTSPRPLNEASESVAQLHQLLVDSLSFRILNIPRTTRAVHQTVTGSPDEPARLAILFSGGLDCTVLARICHDILPEREPIELLNVAFQNPRVHKTVARAAEATAEIYETCPDRITGRSSFEELCKVCTNREWRFVAVNVPYQETLLHRQKIITLMHPHNTEMDLSIALALYFASRGSGTLHDHQKAQSELYVSSARVLVSGLGADELFGGYTRHATAYRRGGYEDLIAELNLDIARLGTRNLGRDDRVLSHWGKETRFPFLDERLLKWAVAVPVQEKCGFGEVENDPVALGIEPGKKVLRCLAAKLGMKRAAMEKKRAIQFGARTAKMEDGKTRGTHVLRE